MKKGSVKSVENGVLDEYYQQSIIYTADGNSFVFMGNNNEKEFVVRKFNKNGEMGEQVDSGSLQLKYDNYQIAYDEDGNAKYLCTILASRTTLEVWEIDSRGRVEAIYKDSKSDINDDKTVNFFTMNNVLFYYRQSEGKRGQGEYNIRSITFSDSK